MKSHVDKSIFICIYYPDKSGTKMKPRMEKENADQKQGANC